MKKTINLTKSPRTISGKYFTYHQNNVGGNFVLDNQLGIGHFIIVKANNLDKASQIFESIIGQLNHNLNCPCCGDRWELINESKNANVLFFDIELRNEDGIFKKKVKTSFRTDRTIFVHFSSPKKMSSVPFVKIETIFDSNI